MVVSFKSTRIVAYFIQDTHPTPIPLHSDTLYSNGEIQTHGLFELEL